jgi:hypothetical protein
VWSALERLRSAFTALAVACLVAVVVPAARADTTPTSTGGQFALMIAPTAARYRLFVSTSGNDGNPGTQSAPLRSLGRAAAKAVPGTEVVVAEGTYNGSVRTDVSGTPEARIAFVSPTRSGARIVGDTS